MKEYFPCFINESFLSSKWLCEVKVLLKMVCYTCGLTTLETRYCSFSPLCCFSYVHAAKCSWPFVYCVITCVCFLIYSCILFYYVCITLVAGRWLEVSNRKVLRPATSAQVFLGFPASVSEC